MIADGIGLAGQSQQIWSSLCVGHHAEEWLERTGDWRCTRQGGAPGGMAGPFAGHDLVLLA